MRKKTVAGGKKRKGRISNPRSVTGIFVNPGKEEEKMARKSNRKRPKRKKARRSPARRRPTKKRRRRSNFWPGERERHEVAAYKGIALRGTSETAKEASRAVRKPFSKANLEYWERPQDNG